MKDYGGKYTQVEDGAIGLHAVNSSGRRGSGGFWVYVGEGYGVPPCDFLIVSSGTYNFFRKSERHSLSSLAGPSIGWPESKVEARDRWGCSARGLGSKLLGSATYLSGNRGQ